MPQVCSVAYDGRSTWINKYVTRVSCVSCAWALSPQIELLDDAENHIDISAADLSLRGTWAPTSDGATTAASADLARLCDRHTNSTSESHMWLCSVPAAASDRTCVHCSLRLNE